MERLETHGVAVIPSILTPAECTALEDQMWVEFSDLTKGRLQRDPATWRTLYDLFPLHSMLVQHWSVGHMQWVWDVRQHPSVVGTFAQLWNCAPEDLITSFDGVSLHLPPEETRRGWYRGNDWLHTDMRFTPDQPRMLQAFVTLRDLRPGDATFMYMEGSHKLHKDFGEKFGLTNSKENWFRLATDEQKEFFAECPRVRVEAPAGSLVIWDSRTFHCGSEPLKTRTSPNVRAVAYVCMVPRSMAPVKVQEKRRKTFKELRMTTHVPHECKLFAKTPRTYGNSLPDLAPVPPPRLTPLGQSLV